MKSLLLLTFSVLGAVFGPSQAMAASILDPELASFAVLGHAAVTNTGATTLTGNLGVSPGASITGSGTITLTGAPHQNDSFASTAGTQLVAALTALGSQGVATSQPVDLTGLTLAPGIYSVAAGTNLTGTLTLDGTGFLPADQFWVFQMASTLITAADSKVDVINTSPGAGVFWSVPASATLGAGTSFAGNILALTSITLNTGATIGCGRALASTGAVTMDHNTISIGCAGTGEEGSNGLSGSLVGGAAPFPLPVGPPAVYGVTTSGLVPVPEPSTFLLFGAGLAALAGAAWRRRGN